MRPAGVNCEPRVVRTAKVTPIWASMVASRREIACWVSSSSRAARPRLPVSAIAKNASNEASSGILGLSGMVAGSQSNRVTQL